MIQGEQNIISCFSHVRNYILLKYICPHCYCASFLPTRFMSQFHTAVYQARGLRDNYKQQLTRLRDEVEQNIGIFQRRADQLCSRRLRLIVDLQDTDKSRWQLRETICDFSLESVAPITHEQNIICGKTRLNNTTHEQTIICR